MCLLGTLRIQLSLATTPPTIYLRGTFYLAYFPPRSLLFSPFVPRWPFVLFVLLSERELVFCFVFVLAVLFALCCRVNCWPSWRVFHNRRSLLVDFSSPGYNGRFVKFVVGVAFVRILRVFFVDDRMYCASLITSFRDVVCFIKCNNFKPPVDNSCTLKLKRYDILK